MIAFYLVGGALAGMLMVFVLTGRPIFTRLIGGVIPVLISAIWTKVFVHGRPPSYQLDVFEKRLRGKHFRLRPQAWCRRPHPRNTILAKVMEMERSHG